MEPNEVPKWVETLSWVFVAGSLALAIIGPRLLAPFIEKWKATLPAAPQIGPQLAVVGAAFADRDALTKLTEAVNRLCDIMDDRLEIETQTSQEAKARKMIQELLKELLVAEQSDREKR